MSEKKNELACMGSKLKLLRASLEVRQVDLSRKMGVPASTVSNIEVSENMNLRTLDKYLKGLDLEYSIVVKHPILGRVTLHENVFEEKRDV